MLVTEFVGGERKRFKRRMVVGGIPVPEEEWGMVLEAGLTAIRRLPASEVAHRNVGTRSLRVAREELPP